MNTDIRIKTTLPEHIKTKKLIKKIGYKGFYSLICLWCYVATNKPKGVLTNMTVEDIALAASWDEDAEMFVDTLTRCGFIEKDDCGQLVLHDWEKHNRYAYYSTERSEIAKHNADKRWLKKRGNPDKNSEGNLVKKGYLEDNFNKNPAGNPTKRGNPDKKEQSPNGLNTLFDANGMPTVCKPYAPNPSPSPNPFLENILSFSEDEKGTSDSEKKSSLLKEKKPSPLRKGKLNNIPYSEIISYLNSKTGKDFKSNNIQSQKFIRARWNEGFRLENFQKVIDTMTIKWGKDPEKQDYLRPQTLFGPKFESYLNATITMSNMSITSPKMEKGFAVTDEWVKKMESKYGKQQEEGD